MAFFTYTVKNQHGETVRGQVEAQTQAQAATILRSRQLLVIRLQPLGNETLGFIEQYFGKVKFEEIVNFTRQLSTMITAGLTLVEALAILKQQSSQAFQKVLSDILEQIEGGSTLAKALEAQGKIFSPVYVQLVRAGEAAGALDRILARLADNLEKEKEFRSKTQGALIYPVIVIFAMLGVGGIMMAFVVPKLSQMYKDLGANLPFITQLLIDMANFMAAFWWLIVGMIIVGAWAFRMWHHTPKGRLAFDRFLLRLPILGVLRQKVVLTEFSRTMGLLMSAGISLLQALEILAEATGNTVYRNALRESRNEVEKGVTLSTALMKYEEFPPILTQMIAVGEETGKLDEVLLKISLYFESESEQAVRNLTAAFEPAVMIVLGVAVGVLVIAIILPIYNITSSF